MRTVHKAARRRGRRGVLHIPSILICTLFHAMTGAARTAEAELGEAGLDIAAGDRGYKLPTIILWNSVPVGKAKVESRLVPAGAVPNGSLSMTPIACAKRQIYRHDPDPNTSHCRKDPAPSALKSPAVSSTTAAFSRAPPPPPPLSTSPASPPVAAPVLASPPAAEPALRLLRLLCDVDDLVGDA